MNETGIKWTDFTWNTFSGCDKVSEGCEFCYAKKLSENKSGTAAFPNGFERTIRPHKLGEPFGLKKPALIFVNSMSDFFWEAITDALRDQIVDVMEATPQHQYQVLTKRHEELLRYSRRRKLPSNFWAGVSIENQEWACRAEVLRQVDAEIRFLSLEPLLGPIELDYSGIGWVIVGGESGPHLSKQKHADRALVHHVDGKWAPRPDRIDWVRRIRDACSAATTPFFFKQWGGPTSRSGGDVIDGRQWRDFPRWRVEEFGKQVWKEAQRSE